MLRGVSCKYYLFRVTCPDMEEAWLGCAFSFVLSLHNMDNCISHSSASLFIFCIHCLQWNDSARSRMCLPLIKNCLDAQLHSGYIGEGWGSIERHLHYCRGLVEKAYISPPAPCSTLFAAVVVAIYKNNSRRPLQDSSTPASRRLPPRKS